MNRNDSPWANPALALALLRPRNAAPKPQQPPPCDTPSCQQAANKERETEKGKSPCTPFKEKDKGKEFPPSPAHTPARAYAQGEQEQDKQEQVGLGHVLKQEQDKQEQVGLGHVSKQEQEQSYTGRIDYNFVMDPRRDPVQMAMIALNIPATHLWNGKVYTHAGLIRWLIPQIGGEGAFRELVYQQLCENETDGDPRSYAAVFFAKLYARRDAMRGGEGTPTACKKASANAAARLRTESREARRSVSGASLPCIGVDETRGGVA